MNKNKDIQNIARSVGNFIQYWGFRNIHGRVWTVIYLSHSPISTHEIIELLGISKSLASRSINELLKYKLIIDEGSTIHGRCTYSASQNIGQIVISVLKSRELNLLRENVESIEKLCKKSSSDLTKIGISPKRLKRLASLTKGHYSLLSLFLRKNPESLEDWISLTKISSTMLKLIK